MKFWQSVLCVVLASVLRNSALAQSTVAQEEGALPQELPDAQALQGSFGNINASVAPSINLANSLKEGKPVPFAVRQAYIATQKDDASKITGGVQTQGFGGFPWTDNGRLDPRQLRESTSAILNAKNSVPQCQVTVKLAPTKMPKTDGVSVLLLIFANWNNETVKAPWTTTLLQSRPLPIVAADNVDVQLNLGRVVRGTVQNASVVGNGLGSVSISFAINASLSIDLLPTAVYQNDRKCILVRNGLSASAFDVQRTPFGSTGRPETPMRLSGPNIIGVDGEVLAMKGLNWFGFDDGVTMLEGLWYNNGMALESDFATIVQRIRLLGFNAVRLPFSMQDLFSLQPKSATQKCVFPTDAQILQSVTKTSNNGRRMLEMTSAAPWATLNDPEESPSCGNEVPPSSELTCKQQSALGRCEEPFMQGFCSETCRRCSVPQQARDHHSHGQPLHRRHLQQASEQCTDVPPDSQYSCQQQKNFGKCNEPFLANRCNKTCGRCVSGACKDVLPDPEFNCQQQKDFGKCNEPFMEGRCNRTCGRCGQCTDQKPPASAYSCPEQAKFGQCNQPFMQGFCKKSCGKCGAQGQPQASSSSPSPSSAGCTDTPPPGSFFTCAQQAGFGKCGESFISGFCLKSCNRCPMPPAMKAAMAASSVSPNKCTDKAPSSDFTCAQQAKFGKCNASFLKGFCNRSCGRCGSQSKQPDASPLPPASSVRTMTPRGSTPVPKQGAAKASCADIQPPGEFTCSQQRDFGKCSNAFLQQYCAATCGRCSTGVCTDKQTPAYTCAQQKAFGACTQSFITDGGFCNRTCGRCSTPAAAPTPAAASTPAAAATPAAASSKSTPGSSASSSKTVIVPPATATIPVPNIIRPTDGPSGTCNGYLPADSTFNRFMYVVQFLARNELYVLLDNQFNFDTTAITDTSGWVEGWRRIARAVNADATVAYRCMYDVLNEPDAFGLRFEPRDGRPGMKDLYFSAFDAIYEVNPASIMVIEGLGQQSYSNNNWGDGLITDPQVLAAPFRDLSDPRPFFNELLKKPYRKQTIVAVHIYPPSISKAKSQFTAHNGLYQRLTLSHGYLNKKGYCNGNDCQVFPVMYGEFGTALEDSRDQAWIKDIIPYMTATGAGDDGQHEAIQSWFWWAWPQNSGDTGGILKTNWLDINYEKVDYLTQLGLRPWYQRIGGRR